MFRASFPSIFGSFRILYDIGWTYVILAEMVNARKGVGYMVEAARKVLDFDRVYAGIIAIGVAAFLFRLHADPCSSAGCSPGAGRRVAVSAPRGRHGRRQGAQPCQSSPNCRSIESRSATSRAASCRPPARCIQAIHDINFEVEDALLARRHATSANSAFCSDHRAAASPPSCA